VKNVDYEIYRPSTGLLPELPSVGYAQFHRAAWGGQRPDDVLAYEICYIEKGSIEWWIDDTLQEFGSGTVFINQPGEWHGGDNALLHPCEIYWVQFKFPPEGTLHGFSSDALHDLQTHFTNPQPRNFPANVVLKSLFYQLLQEYRTPSNHAQPYARAIVNQLLIATRRAIQNQETQHYPDPIQRSINWMHTYLSEDMRVDDMAQIAEMSVSYFHQQFLEHVGYTPVEYQARQRIQLAKVHLRQSTKSITHIAHHVGFSSSQYFATVFKRITGTTPREYRDIVRG